VAAFRSTLQEASEADLLLHVIDANAQDREDKISQVNQVLTEIEAAKIPQLQVFNKIDQLEAVEPHIDRDEFGKPQRIWLSAQTGAGIELLYQALAELFSSSKVKLKCQLLADQGDIYAKLFRLANIMAEQTNDDGSRDLIIEMDRKHLAVLKAVAITEIG
jgi:GTP-binding protein HflX